jgi:uncharacterized phage protein (TIGR02218 family)
MKPAVADYRYKIHCIRIVPLWGSPVYLTSHVRDIVIGANTYLSGSGYEFSGQSLDTSLAPGVIDLKGIADIAEIDYNEIVSGVFDNARVYCFATTWNNPVVDEEPIGLAFMGKTRIDDDRYTTELMMLIDVLNQTVGKTYGTQCPKKFGGQEYAGCKFVLGPVTVTGTITHVTSNSVFRDSSRAEAADYFGEGTIAFINSSNATPQNAGLKPQEIKIYAADGTITTHEAFHYQVAVGDEYIMIPGCRKRLEDCRDKWNNVVNFGGFSFIPTSSQYQSRGLN